MGPGRELYGDWVRTRCNWVANGLKTLSTGRVGYLKGLAGPVHHGPGNHHLQTMLPVPHTLTTSWASVTKAGGLSDTPGA